MHTFNEVNNTALRTLQELETNLENLIDQGFYLSSDVILGFLKNIKKF